MTELEAIRERHRQCKPGLCEVFYAGWACNNIEDMVCDVPFLVAEVERLRGVVRLADEASKEWHGRREHMFTVMRRLAAALEAAQ